MQTNSIEKGSVSFRVLTHDQVAEIRRASFDVMAKVGFKVLHEGARKMLKQAGENHGTHGSAGLGIFFFLAVKFAFATAFLFSRRFIAPQITSIMSISLNTASST